MRLPLQILLLVLFCIATFSSGPSSRSRWKALTWTMEAMLGRWSGGSCQWPHVTGKQRRMCQREGSRAVLEKARSLAVTHCRQAFQYEPWNCSLQLAGTHFLRSGKVYRETALLGAVVGAALTYAAARACAQGTAQFRCDCKPGAVVDPLAVRRALRSGSCDDDLRAGRRFARNLLMLAAIGDDPVAAAMRANVELGIKMASQRTEELCRCSGPSGSCARKTCWRRAPPFARAVETLRARYYRAVRAEPRNSGARRKGRRRQRVSSSALLLYLDPSPDLCGVTRGRACRGDDNCERLCCLRGYVVRHVSASRYCRCAFRHGAVLDCQLCRYVREARFCR